MGSRKEATIFSINQSVRWVSSAGGFSKVKFGVIIDVIPPYRELPDKYRIAPKSKCKTPGGARNHESYVIRATDDSIYWPKVDQLEIEY